MQNVIGYNVKTANKLYRRLPHDVTPFFPPFLVPNRHTEKTENSNGFSSFSSKVKNVFTIFQMYVTQKIYIADIVLWNILVFPRPSNSSACSGKLFRR